MIGYRLYHDLRRGRRVTSPSALAGATADTRLAVAKTLLDFMRRELAVQVDYLDATKQETIQQQSSQRLITPWALDENELLEHAATLYPRSTRQGDFGGDVFVTARSGFGLYLRRTGTFPQYHDRLTTTEVNEIIRQLLDTLRLAGLVEIVDEAKSPTGLTATASLRRPFFGWKEKERSPSATPFECLANRKSVDGRILSS